MNSLDKKESAALTIGSFDGCHIGHQQLIHEMLHLAKAHNQTPTVLTFYPHPRDFFQNSGTTNCLFTIEMKKRFLKSLGVEHILVQSFDLPFSTKSAQWFYEDFLCKQLKTQTLMVGPNFHFGHKREGCIEWLQKQQHGPSLKVLTPLLENDSMISSSRIRSYLRNGDPQTAAKLLGRDYLLEGQLKPGDKIGRKIQVPTLNLENISQLIPKYGVYLGYVWIAEPQNTDSPPIQRTDAHPALINIGLRPTVDGTRERVEAHLLYGEWPEEMYEKKAGFYLHQYLRNEKKFEDINELKTALYHDIQRGRHFFHNP
ncbi:MAG: riboflavin biosynthesis protein RibF [Oligoflexales bacterium]